MAKKPAATQSAQPNEDSSIAEFLASGEELSPALEKLYAEMGLEGDEGQANVYISKMLADGREAKIWNGPPADYDLMTVARKYGSGDYRVKLYVQSANGRFVMKGNQVFPVMLEAGEDARLAAMREGKQVAPSGEVVAQQPQANVADIVKAATEAAVAAMRAAQPQPANNLGMLKEVAEIVRTLAPQPQVPAFNPVDILRIAADFARPREDTDPIERGVNATGTDVFMRLIDRFAPMFAQTLAASGAQGNPALPAPAANGETGNPANPQPAQSAENEAMMKLRMGLKFLCMQAQSGNAPETYADVVLDNVPEEDLAQFMQNQNPVAFLATIEPEVGKHVEWFRKLIEEVKAELNAPPEQVDPAKNPA